MFKINDSLSITVENQNIIGKLIGIDTYSMENFAGRKVRWTSHTLVSNLSAPFSRYWITNRGKEGWYLSTISKKTKPPKLAQVCLERSGLAQIDFKGDQGVSTPTAALLAYKLSTNTYFTIERFSKSEIMFFNGQKIQKPKVIES